MNITKDGEGGSGTCRQRGGDGGTAAHSAVQGGEGVVPEADDAAPGRGDLPGGEVGATVLQCSDGIIVLFPS